VRTSSGPTVPPHLLHQVRSCRSIPSAGATAKASYSQGSLCVCERWGAFHLINTNKCALHDLPPLSSGLFLVQLFQLLLCASTSAGGSTTHPADLSSTKVSLVGQFPSSSSVVMSLIFQVACVFSSAGPLFPPLELIQGHCMILFHAVRSNCDRHSCELLCSSSVDSICCHRPRCHQLVIVSSWVRLALSSKGLLRHCFGI
jgi:hypothetical protein